MRVLIFFLCLSGFVFGGGPAGCVLFAKKNGEVVLLLASHVGNTRGFAGFGGKDEEGESVLDTAVRETEEETRGYFKRGWLRGKIGEQEPVVKFGYSMYFVEVPWVDVKVIEGMKLAKKGAGVMGERDCYVWVPAKDLLRVLDGGKLAMVKGDVGEGILPKGAREDYYWRLWLVQMLDARGKGKVSFWE